MTRELIYSIPIPKKTESYSPVSNRAIVSKIERRLHENNMEIENEKYNIGRSGNQVIGLMSIRHNDNKDIGMQIAWRNSYDKSKTIAFVAGGHAWICMNGMIIGEVQYIRKHIGDVVQELSNKIKIVISQLKERFVQTVNYAERMKKVVVEKRLMAELAGRLFIEHEIITAQQLSIIKHEILLPTFEDFKYNNLWSFYNHVTFSLKDAHPDKYLIQHTNFHKFIEKEFELV